MERRAGGEPWNVTVLSDKRLVHSDCFKRHASEGHGRYYSDAELTEGER